MYDWVPDAGNVLLVGVLNLKMYALWGAPLTRANEYINFSKCMQAWGGLHLNPIDLFFPGKHTETHGETWEYLGSPKIFCAEDSVSLRFWIFLETNTCITYANTIKHASLPLRRHDTIFWNVCIAGGTNDYLSQIYSLHFPKMMCFSATQPP